MLLCIHISNKPAQRCHVCYCLCQEVLCTTLWKRDSLPKIFLTKLKEGGEGRVKVFRPHIADGEQRQAQYTWGTANTLQCRLMERYTQNRLFHPHVLLPSVIEQNDGCQQQSLFTLSKGIPRDSSLISFPKNESKGSPSTKWGTKFAGTITARSVFLPQPSTSRDTPPPSCYSLTEGTGCPTLGLAAQEDVVL